MPKLLAHSPNNITTEHEISARNRLFNIDGLGVAWYTTSNADFEKGNTGQSDDGSQKEGVRPALYKTVQPPLNDLNFRSICQNTESRVVFAHIRAASHPPITAVNNHPFAFGRHAFMHNGVISDFISIRRQMTEKMCDAAYANVLGSTDSEHLAGLYVTYLTDGGDENSWEKEYSAEQMAEALHKAVVTVIELQKATLGDKASPNSLNLCITDGVKLIAYRFRNHAVEQPPSLYYSTKAGVTLNRKYPDHPDGIDVPPKVGGKAEEEHGEHIIVASEPSTYRQQDWELIGKNQVLIAEPDGKLEVKDVPYKKEYDSNVESNEW